MTSARPSGLVVVVEMSAEAGEETGRWLAARIQAPKQSGGCDLRVTSIQRPEGDKGMLLLVSASLERLLRGAEELGLMKEDKDGNFKPFRQGLASDESHVLSAAESLYVIKRGLDALKAAEEGEESVPGQPGVPLSPGQPILSQLLLSKLVRQLYPLHDREELEGLWRGGHHLISQPVDPLRDYFGESVALYFGFLGYFTWGVAFKTLLEVFLYAVGLKEGGGRALSAAYNIAWVTAFPKGWKRKSSALAFRWGTLQHRLEPLDLRLVPEELRPGFGGRSATFLERQRYLRVLGASVPFVGLSLYVTVLLMQTFLHLEAQAKASHAREGSGRSATLRYAPLLGYCLVLEALNKLYLLLAQAFTELEKHPSASSHHNHLLAKILLFYFVNNFGMLYFLAFYRRDFELLSETLSAQLLVHQLVGQTLDGFLPYWKVAFKRKRLQRALSRSADAGLWLAEADGDLEPPTDDLLKDYLEVFLMVGYANLFSSVAPLSAGLCLLHNLTGLRAEGLKFKAVLQRPFPQPSADIGVWQLAFEGLSSLAIVTNCALVGSSPGFRALFDLPDGQYFLVAVALEHGLLGVQQLVNTAVPRVPADIAERLERMGAGCRGGGGWVAGGLPCEPPRRRPTSQETTTEYLDCLEDCLTRSLNQLNKNYQS